MVKWEYLWRKTYYAEVERTQGYIQWVSYRHVWKPNRTKEEEMLFPSDDGMDELGERGWELVAMTSESVSLVTGISPQKGDIYSNFTTYLLMFKRPLR